MMGDIIHFPVAPVYSGVVGGDFRLVGNTFYVDTLGRTNLITDGFVFSPSIPRIFKPLVPDDSDTIIASLPHDWLYQQQSTSRAFADDQWKAVLESVNKEWNIIQRSYWALRLGGFVAWSENKESKTR